MPATHHDWAAATETSIAAREIAYSPDLGHATLDPEITGLVAKAVQVLRDLGANVEEVEAAIPLCRDVFEAHWFAGAINLARDWSGAILRVLAAMTALFLNQTIRRSLR